MKKIYFFFILFSFSIVYSQSSEELLNKFIKSGGIVCFYTKKESSPIQKEVNMFVFWEEKQEVLKVLDNNFSEYPAKLDRTYIEQGLYIKEYIPTNLLNNPIKRIFKFCYKEDSKEPIVVVEISYTSKNNYTITKYFTSEWARLSNYD